MGSIDTVGHVNSIIAVGKIDLPQDAFRELTDCSGAKREVHLRCEYSHNKNVILPKGVSLRHVKLN